mmetsp:Transcript_20907/g.59626  ORF Transcript_20907/g.59626 Transcript_20907/m.59626 type:complete len:213 (+) Transcript_20907:1002-1640(+)
MRLRESMGRDRDVHHHRIPHAVQFSEHRAVAETLPPFRHSDVSGCHRFCGIDSRPRRSILDGAPDVGSGRFGRRLHRVPSMDAHIPLLEAAAECCFPGRRDCGLDARPRARHLRPFLLRPLRARLVASSDELRDVLAHAVLDVREAAPIQSGIGEGMRNAPINLAAEQRQYGQHRQHARGRQFGASRCSSSNENEYDTRQQPSRCSISIHKQ